MVATLAIAALFSGFTSLAKACQGADTAPAEQSTDEMRGAMACLINKTRAHHNLRHLRGSVPLGIAAQGHSNSMVAYDFFSHGGDGTPTSRAAAAGYGGGGKFKLGENLGWGGGSMGSPRTIFRAWMASPSHRQVILLRGVRQIGVGVALGSPAGADYPDTATYTVDLGRP